MIRSALLASMILTISACTIVNQKGESNPAETQNSAPEQHTNAADAPPSGDTATPANAAGAATPSVVAEFESSGEGVNQKDALMAFNADKSLTAPTFVIVKLHKTFDDGSNDYNAVWIIAGKRVPMHQLESSYVSMAPGSPILLSNGEIKVKDKVDPSKWYTSDIAQEQLSADRKGRLVDYENFALMTINVDGAGNKWDAKLMLLAEPLLPDGEYLLFP